MSVMTSERHYYGRKSSFLLDFFFHKEKGLFQGGDEGLDNFRELSGQMNHHHYE